MSRHASHTLSRAHSAPLLLPLSLAFSHFLALSRSPSLKLEGVGAYEGGGLRMSTMLRERVEAKFKAARGELILACKRMPGPDQI